MTAPELAVGQVAGPTVCKTCCGEGVIDLDDPMQSAITQPCPDCGCSCGRGPMRVGLMCEACHEEIDDDQRHVRAGDR